MRKRSERRIETQEEKKGRMEVTRNAYFRGERKRKKKKKKKKKKRKK